MSMIRWRKCKKYFVARYTSYGCHCLLGPDVARTLTRVPSVDDVDEVCRRQTMCMQCAKIDNDADCQGGVKDSVSKNTDT